MDQEYERGWRRYSFGEIPMNPVQAHGGDVTVHVGTAFNRGPGNLQVSLIELPWHKQGAAIGLHIHRDLPTGQDVEELYIIVEGECVMTFTNGDEVTLGPGDVVTTYPGTGHSLRVVGQGRARVAVVVPRAFRAGRPPISFDSFPEEFSPRIQVLAVDPLTMVPLEARCALCGETWSVDPGGPGLPRWAAGHQCRSSSLV